MLADAAFHNSSAVTVADVRGSLANIEAHPLYWYMRRLKKISMLDLDALFLLRLFALHPPGGILELGPYIGGSTAAIASGVIDGSGAPFVSVEVGGRYLEHQQLPSHDIFADLERTVRTLRIDSTVRLINGGSDDRSVIEQVKAALGETGVGLLFIDSDGHIERDMRLYRPLMNKNCIVAFDDYGIAETAMEGVDPDLVFDTWKDPKNKASRIRAAVDEAVRDGLFEPFGVFGFGTWFGRYRG